MAEKHFHDFTTPGVLVVWNFPTPGMAQFLDFDMDSDEDFEESVQQGKFSQDFHFGLEKCNTIANIPSIFVKW